MESKICLLKTNCNTHLPERFSKGVIGPGLLKTVDLYFPLESLLYVLGVLITYDGDNVYAVFCEVEISDCRTGVCSSLSSDIMVGENLEEERVNIPDIEGSIFYLNGRCTSTFFPKGQFIVQCGVL